jgi:hypothetical protein
MAQDNQLSIAGTGEKCHEIFTNVMRWGKVICGYYIIFGLCL